MGAVGADINARPGGMRDDSPNHCLTANVVRPCCREAAALRVTRHALPGCAAPLYVSQASHAKHEQLVPAVQCQLSRDGFSLPGCATPLYTLQSLRYPGRHASLILHGTLLTGDARLEFLEMREH